LKNESYPIRLRGSLADALAAAGTPACQGALYHLLKGSLDSKFREVAVGALAALEKPTPEIEDVLKQQTAASEKNVSSTALLTLGIMASKVSARTPNRAEDIGAFLDKAGRQAQSMESRLLHLEAIGNAGLSRALPQIEESLGDPDPLVRGTALHALRFIPEARADEILLKRLSSDPASVRAQSVSALRHRSPEIATQSLAIARGDSSLEVRMEALRSYGLRLRSDPSARNVVQEFSLRDPDSNVRQQASKLLEQLKK